MTATSYRAYAWRSGAIDVSNGRTPKGAIKLVTFRSRRAALVGTRVIEAIARHAYDGTTILVPGIPEADNDDDALNALLRWSERLSSRLARRLPARSYRVEVAA